MNIQKVACEAWLWFRDGLESGSSIDFHKLPNGRKLNYILTFVSRFVSHNVCHSRTSEVLQRIAQLEGMQVNPETIEWEEEGD